MHGLLVVDCISYRRVFLGVHKPWTGDNQGNDVRTHFCQSLGASFFRMLNIYLHCAELDDGVSSPPRQDVVVSSQRRDKFNLGFDKR